jgi:hypothetical protein
MYHSLELQLHGGMAALERFWADYKSVADNLHVLNAIPEKAAVIRLSAPV